MGGPGSGRKKGSGGGTSTPAKSFSVSPAKMKKNPIPKTLKKKWAKTGGVNNPEYKSWIEKNWKS